MYSLHVKNAEVNNLTRQNQNLTAQITNYQAHEKNIVADHEAYLIKLNEQHALQLKTLGQSHQMVLNELTNQNVAQLKMMTEKNRVELIAVNELHSEALKQLEADYSAKVDVALQESLEWQNHLQATVQQLEIEKVTNGLLRRELVSVKYQELTNKQLKHELDFSQSELNRIHRMNHLAHLKIQELTPKLSALQSELQHTRAALVCMENSLSWKITRPLRKLKAILTRKSVG